MCKACQDSCGQGKSSFFSERQVKSLNGEGDVLHWGSVVCAVTGKEAEIDWKHWVPLASLLALF